MFPSSLQDDKWGILSPLLLRKAIKPWTFPIIYFTYIHRPSTGYMFVCVCVQIAGLGFPNSVVSMSWFILDGRIVTYHYHSARLPSCRTSSVVLLSLSPCVLFVCVYVCVCTRTDNTCLSYIILSIFDSSPQVTHREHKVCVCVWRYVQQLKGAFRRLQRKQAGSHNL